MKKISLIMIGFIIFLSGCVGAPPLPEDLCAEFDKETSFIEQTAAKYNIPLNEVYYGLLDATTIAMVMEAVQKEDLKTFLDDVGKWYSDHYPVSYTTLIEYMVNGEKAMQLSGILTRRIGMFKSYLIISKYDDCLLRAGWSGARRDLYLD